MTDQLDELAMLVARLERDFGTPLKFIASLPGEDDWSFVIKAQALVEAAVTQLVTVAIGRPSLNPAIDAANLLGRSGKLEMAKAMRLLDADASAFVQRLAQLRNTLIHDVTRASFTFSEHLEALNAGEQEALRRALMFMSPAALTTDGPFSARIRFVVWMHLLAFLVKVNEKRTTEEKNRELAELEAEVGREAMYGPDSHSDPGAAG